MFNIIFSFTILASSAFAAEYPEIITYRTRAEAVLTLAQSSLNAQAIEQLRVGTRALIQTGVQVMNLYAQKNPVCAEQFRVMIAEIPTMETQTVAALHDRYHDGAGLPIAPRHCYFGRSQVVHPAMNWVRLKSPMNDEVKAEMIDEIQEVIEHLDRIQRNLDNPPTN